jgi:hypothetical protein
VSSPPQPATGRNAELACQPHIRVPRSDDGRHAIDLEEVTCLAVGGLTEVGFADGPLLLVVSEVARRCFAEAI